MLKQIEIFLRIFPFTNMVRKTNFPSFSVLVSEISLLFLKRKVLHKFLQKCLKKTEKHSLAVCGILCGEKQFLLIFMRFYWFDQKHLLKQIQIFPQDLPFFKHGKKNKLSEIISARFWDNHLCLKRKVLYDFTAKYFRTTERLSLVVCGLLCGEKQFLLIFILLLQV